MIEYAGMNARRIIGSTTICIFGLLFLAEIGYRLGHFNVRQTVDRAPLVHNIQSTMADKSVMPDVLVVGSSLSYCFTYDVTRPSKRDEEPVVDKSLNCAPDAFLSDLLSNQMSRRVNVDVIALPGAMAAEITNIVETAFKSGKHPKVVVYLAAPRDFVDRTSKPQQQLDLRAEKSKVASGGAARRNIGPQRFAPDRIVPPAVLSKLDALTKTPSVALACELMFDCCSQIYEQRSQLRSSLVDLMCNILDRDADLWAAAHQIRKTVKGWTKLDRDLADYANRYNPPDFAKLKEQAPQLLTLQQICLASGARLMIVNMPLTAENKRLLDGNLYREYKGLLAKVSAAPSVVVADFDSSQYSHNEFLDSAHLNAFGSRRLQETLAPRLLDLLAHQ